MRISVFGLGYVGTVSAACLTELGHSVIGVDISEPKVAMMGEGKSPVLEKGLGEMISKGVRDGRLQATTDARRAVFESDLSLICVGTPSAENGSLSTQAIEGVMGEVGSALGEKEGRHTIVLRSTVLPGTCRSLVLPLLCESSGLPHTGFGLGYNPEFLREGSSVDDFFHPPKTVIGSLSEEDGMLIQGLYTTLPGPVFPTSIEVAEMIKYVDNPFHALKVAFANEIGALCRSLSVDAHEVIDIFLKDEKLNISPAYLRPGFAFGGSCLPKDLRALLYCAKTRDVDLPLLSSVLSSNELHLQRGLAMVLKTGAKRIGLVGLSFKSGTDDLRESPYVRLAEALIGKGKNLRILDSHVSLARLTGANRRYIESEIPHIAELLVDSLGELTEFAEVVVLTRDGERERKLLSELGKNQIAIDLAGIRGGGALCGGRYLGITEPDSLTGVDETKVGFKPLEPSRASAGIALE